VPCLRSHSPGLRVEECGPGGAPTSANDRTPASAACGGLRPNWPRRVGPGHGSVASKGVGSGIDLGGASSESLNVISNRCPVALDAAEIFRRWTQDPGVTRYLVWQPHTSLAESEAHISRCQESWEEGSAFVWFIEDRESGELVDQVMKRNVALQASIQAVLVAGGAFSTYLALAPSKRLEELDLRVVGILGGVFAGAMIPIFGFLPTLVSGLGVAFPWAVAGVVSIAGLLGAGTAVGLVKVAQRATLTAGGDATQQLEGSDEGAEGGRGILVDPSGS